MKRVLCLYRVSSKGQVDQNDIPMQRIACREYIAQHSDWVLYDEKLEKGVSGFKLSADKRDKIIEIRKEAEQKKFDILLCLASHPGRVFTKDQLYDYAWDDKIIYNVASVIKTHISSLRQNMSEADIEYIRNVWGIGYRFQYEG